MSIKLVALDLDDTLLDGSLKISDKCIDTIRAVREKGVMVTLATGRMFRSALPYAHQLNLDIPLITYEGAWVKNSFSRQELYNKPVPPKLAREIMNFFKQREVHFHTYYDDLLCMEALTGEGQYYAEIAGVEPVLMEDLAEVAQSRETPKILAVTYDEDLLLDMEKKLQEQYGKDLFITRSKPYFLEVMDKEATKARALQVIAEHFNIARSEVMAVGDSYNDLAMIEWAGIGVAMSNACGPVKEKADFVTTSNEEEGVAEALQRLVL